MTYASVCSGIEAASVAWEPLGWRPAWFAEIEPFPSAVLAHRFPNVPNLGDMTKIKGDEHGAVDLLVGGTPCQDLSIAGKRMGFRGSRSVLALDFVRLAYESGARWFVFENVPGVFSSTGGEDFAQLLSLFAGWQVDVPTDGWRNFGIVEQSPGCFGLAWRVIDVQYARVDGFERAIPQRRRRVFLVGYLGDWRRAAQVLFEPEGLLGNTPPRREAGKGTAGGAGSCAPEAVRGREDTETIVFDARGNGDGDVCPTVTGDHAGRPTDYTPAVLAAHSFMWQSGFADGGDKEVCGTLVKNQHPAVVCRMTAFGEYETDGTASTMKQRDYKDATDLVVAFAQNSRDEVRLQNGDGRICGALAAEPGMKQQTYVAIADVIHGDKSCNGKGWKDDGSAYTLDTMATQGLMQASTVRRLTPRECERLMGFQDDWARIPWRGKPAEQCPDGPRYKACGNSMGVNVMRWIGRRIEKVEGEIK